MLPFFIFGAPATVEAGAILARIGTTEKINREKKLKKVEKISQNPLTNPATSVILITERRKER